MAGETPLTPHDDRRRERRHGVKLAGKLVAGANTMRVEIGDLSISGALILVRGAPPAGSACDLWIEDYGPVAIQIMHAGGYFCGVAFTDPTAHRLRLRAWIGDDATPMASRTQDDGLASNAA
jgi:PilZ domain-containing protein